MTVKSHTIEKGDCDDLSKEAVVKTTQIDVSKYERIEDAIRQKNSLALKKACIEAGGLLKDSLRKEAWPIILGLDLDVEIKIPSENEISSHVDHEQVLLDVARSIKRFPPSIPSENRLNLQDKLINVIMRVLLNNPSLHYYQGYHDICVTILLVVHGDEDLAFRIMDHVSRTRLKSFMEKSMETTLKQLSMAYALFGIQNIKLREFLESSECGVVFFLSWCITWFGHDLENYSSLVRLYDFFMANDEDPHLLPVYVAGALILSNSTLIQMQECSLPGIHGVLKKIITNFEENEKDVEDVIRKAYLLYAEFPPATLEKLEAERRRKEEEYRIWTKTLIGATVLRLRLTSWRSRGVIGAFVVVTFAMALQLYRKGITEA